MYAVIATGGKQYKVSEGQQLRVEKIPGDVGQNVNLDQVLMFSDGENVEIGRPLLDSKSVSVKILEQARAKKVLVFKYKRRKRYRRKRGHRQAYTSILIEKINAA